MSVERTFCLRNLFHVKSRKILGLEYVIYHLVFLILNLECVISGDYKHNLSKAKFIMIIFTRLPHTSNASFIYGIVI